VNHIPRSIVLTLGVVKLLALTKPFENIDLIAIGQVMYWTVSKILCLQFHDFFKTHLLL
jgi:hypothetical protein